MNAEFRRIVTRTRVSTPRGSSHTVRHLTTMLTSLPVKIFFTICLPAMKL